MILSPLERRYTMEFPKYTTSHGPIIPSFKFRGIETDLRVLAKRVLEDLLSFDDSKLSVHIVENKDLLSLYVQAALGVEARINWGTATDEEVALMGLWQDYCCKLVRPGEAPHPEQPQLSGASLMDAMSMDEFLDWWCPKLVAHTRMPTRVGFIRWAECCLLLEFEQFSLDEWATMMATYLREEANPPTYIQKGNPVSPVH